MFNYIYILFTSLMNLAYKCYVIIMLYSINNSQNKNTNTTSTHSLELSSSIEDFKNQPTISDNLYHTIYVKSEDEESPLYDSYHLSEDENSVHSQFSRLSFFNVGQELLKSQESNENIKVEKSK